MKKPTLSDALAKKEPVAPAPPEPVAARPKVLDGRINTTVRISPEGLEALKNIAAAKRIRVNDLFLEGAEHVLAINNRKMKLSK